MKRLILALLLSTAAWAVTDFAPHNLIGYGSNGFHVTTTNEYGTYPAWRMFDSPTTADIAHMGMFASATGSVTLQMAAPQVPTSYAIKCFFDGNDSGWPTQANRAPKDFNLAGSNDGTTWTTLDTQTGQTNWTTMGETRTFSFTNSTAYKYLRLSVTANNGDAYTIITELFFYADALGPTTEHAPHNMTTNSAPSPYVASASTELYDGVFWSAFKAFDGQDRWIGNNGTADWLKIDMGAGNNFVLSAYTVSVSPGDYAYQQAPKAWTMEGSNDNAAWTTLSTQTNQISWNPLESRIYYVSGTSYRYYRLNISVYQTGQSIVSVGELSLWGESASPAGRMHRMLE